MWIFEQRVAYRTTSFLSQRRRVAFAFLRVSSGTWSNSSRSNGCRLISSAGGSPFSGLGSAKPSVVFGSLRRSFPAIPVAKYPKCTNILQPYSTLATASSTAPRQNSFSEIAKTDRCAKTPVADAAIWRETEEECASVCARMVSVARRLKDKLEFSPSVHRLEREGCRSSRLSRSS